jgi:chromosome segregation protein
MLPRWTLAAAFAAGLVPGLLLYWTARTPPPAPSVATPAAPTPAAAPLTPPNPLAAAPTKTSEPRTTRPLPSADTTELQARLQAAHQDALTKLSAAEKAAADAQAKLHELEPRLSALSEQHQATQNHEKELRQQLDAVQRQLATAEASAKSRDSRLAELELAQQQTQRKGADSTQRLQRVTELVGELEENNRRRESYLNAILGRYREATDLFRAMSLRLDNPRDVATPLHNDLSRIQTAIQSADEDLRQLRALNAQSARLQKEIAARK